MEHFTPREWLYIDVCNKAGNDKALYRDRILWTLANYDNLEDIKAPKQGLYNKAVLALRDMDSKIPTGHLVALDAIAQGMSILSTLTRCAIGMRNTGVISDGTRADPYTKLSELLDLDIPREDAKESLMQKFYGGNKTAKLVFGEHLPKFYLAAQRLAPRAYEMIDVWVNAWQENALEHVVITPNKSTVKLRTWVKKNTRITVPNLDKRSFTFCHEVNQGTEKGLALAAHCTHLTDAFMVQEMGARCNYDKELLEYCQGLIEYTIGDTPVTNRDKIPSLDLLPDLNPYSIKEYDHNFLAQLLEQINRTLEYKPFPVLMNHDSFSCHPNNVEQMRKHYNRLLWDLYNSTWISDMHKQITGKPLQQFPYSPIVAEKILENDYALN